MFRLNMWAKVLEDNTAYGESMRACSTMELFQAMVEWFIVIKTFMLDHILMDFMMEPVNFHSQTER